MSAQEGRRPGLTWEGCYELSGDGSGSGSHEDPMRAGRGVRFLSAGEGHLRSSEVRELCQQPRTSRGL